MIHLIWIIPGYIAAGFLLATIAKSELEDVPWIILFWPLFIALCVLAGIIEVYTKMEDKHNDNR